MGEFSMTFNLSGPAPRDPQTIYNLGQGFYLAGQRCGLNIEVGPGVTQCLVAPAVVNYCLAIELFFKALIQESGSDPKKTHDLEALFAALPDRDRSALTVAYSQVVPDPSITDLLREAGGYFNKVRYDHEFGVFAYHEATIASLAKTSYIYCSRLSPPGSPVAPLRP